MILDEAIAVLPFWLILSAAFGFLAGEACGDHSRHRKCLEQANADLRNQLHETGAGQEPLCRELKRMRGELNDIHKHVLAVSKGLQNRPS